MSYATYLTDPLRVDVFLVTLYPYSISGATTVTLRYSTGPYRSKTTDSPASTAFDARCMVSLNRDSALGIPGTLRIASETSGGEVMIGARYGDLDVNADNYLWDGRRAVVQHVI